MNKFGLHSHQGIRQIFFTGIAVIAVLLSFMISAHSVSATELRGTGDLGLVIERADGSVLIVEHSTDTILGRVEGLGNLSHASVVFSRDERFAYVFGRDGGLTKVDMLRRVIAKRIIQAGNSIGGAISQDGKLVAVSNYTPGGVKVFDAVTLELVADIVTDSKTVGLVDAPGQKFVFSLYDTGEIWVADFSNLKTPEIQKFTDIGVQPYDALLTPGGRFYVAGLFGEDGMSKLDMWNLSAGPTRVLSGYGRGEKPLPVYKMPHLEGWAQAGDFLYVPAVGRHEVLIIDPKTWQEVGRIQVLGQPVFVMARPDGREVWVNFAIPHNDTVQVINAQKQKLAETLKPGKAILHMEFTPRGEKVWLSVRDEDTLRVYDTATHKQIKQLPALKPSGIFFTNRAHKTGL